MNQTINPSMGADLDDNFIGWNPHHSPGYMIVTCTSDIVGIAPAIHLLQMLNAFEPRLGMVYSVVNVGLEFTKQKSLEILTECCVSTAQAYSLQQSVFGLVTPGSQNMIQSIRWPPWRHSGCNEVQFHNGKIMQFFKFYCYWIFQER